MSTKDNKQRLFEVMENVAFLPKKDIKVRYGNNDVNELKSQLHINQSVSSSDVKTLKNVNQDPELQNARENINSMSEFPIAFRMWFQSLGIERTSTNATIENIKSDVEDVLKKLGYK